MILIYKRPIKLLGRGGTITNLLISIILGALMIFFHFGPQYLGTRKFADFFCARITPNLSRIGSSIVNMSPVCITELIVILIAVSIIPVLIILISEGVYTIRKQGFSKLLNKFSKLTKVSSIILLFFSITGMLFEGINYLRTPTYEKMGLITEAYEYEDVIDALNWTYVNMIEARQELEEDYRGVAHSKYSFQETVAHANVLLDTVSEKYNLELSTNYFEVKPVFISKYWSLTNTVGQYCPYILEVYVNTDYVDITDTQLSILHELTHAKGYASETDANFVAALAAIHSSRADLRYAGFRYMFIHLYGIGVSYANSHDVNFPAYTSDSRWGAISRDWDASNYYWSYIDEQPLRVMIRDFSQNLNDAFLKSNGQEGGLETYNVPPDLYVSFYEQYVKKGS